MKKRNKHNKSNSDDDDDDVDDDTGKRRNKKVFAFLASGLDGHMTQLGGKKKTRKKDFFPQNCKLFATKKDSQSLQNIIKPPKKASSSIVSHSFCTEEFLCNPTAENSDHIAINSKAKELAIFGANVPKAKAKKFLFYTSVPKPKQKNCLFCATVPEPKEKFPILVLTKT
jgi:hypothetical protein